MFAFTRDQMVAVKDGEVPPGGFISSAVLDIFLEQCVHADHELCARGDAICVKDIFIVHIAHELQRFSSEERCKRERERERERRRDQRR
jgi:hypothetical protein